MSGENKPCYFCDVSTQDGMGSGDFRSWKRYDFCGHTLTIFLDKADYLGAHVWKSALVLCEYFEREKISFAGKKVIELGSGSGIVGILAVLLGGDVTFTDRSFALNQIKHNISVNVPPSCKDRAKVFTLYWEEDPSSFPSDYDIILGSDIVYATSSYPSLLNTLRHLSNPGTTAYICTELRPRNEYNVFHEEMLPQHFNCQVVHKKGSEGINVYKITKKGQSDEDQ
ncbi:EEF1A lysine methyltransferase 3 [Callorhinchus milii]|uniref:Methyltransferase-like protein 21B n=1 Tax=Callorhinchus milii TaxID=7868 RepID=V9L592_CALMI|nr:EEF1A lysine methyltransferase 3 [Callorhinchus milii]XP_007904231.1 EEF1A lysine methyltransferase 3 [Callorhinchus milii]|eukprot:gi/632975439/ref/XP_007904229.1/ PREDICTED: protein-lysine methyltransferase METTL21B-like [Callorhinchus milii]